MLNVFEGITPWAPLATSVTEFITKPVHQTESLQT